MAVIPQKKITNLDPIADTSLTDTDVMPIVSAGVTWKTTLASLVLKLGRAFLPAGVTVTFAKWVSNNSVYNVRDFGAVGDGAVDDFAAIQSAITAALVDALAGGGRVVYFPGGKYKISDTLQVGLNNAFRSVFLWGDGYKYAGQNGFPGPVLIPTQVDRPAVNFQGARGSSIKGMTILGKLDPYISAQNFARTTAPFPTLDDTVAANWDDPGLGGAVLDSRYAPYAAITIDGWAGVQPATHYPTAVQAYGFNAFSSDVLIEDVQIRGFTVGVAVQPSDADGNGDFTNLRRVTFDYCKWGVSIGNTQSRSVAMDDVKMLLSYCVITNNKHGKQLGKFGGSIKNLSVASIMKIMEMGALSYGGPITFVNLYAEALWTIGSAVTASSVENSIAFRQSSFGFDQHVNSRGYPAYIFEQTGSSNADILFDGCFFGNYNSVIGFKGQGFRFDGITTWANSTRTNAYEKFAHNAIVGGVVLTQLGRAGFQPMRARMRSQISYNVDTGAANTQEFTDRIFNSDRARLIPFWGESVSARSAQHDKQPMPFREAWAQPKSTLSAISLTGSTLSITFTASRSEVLFNQYGPLPGDVMWDDNTGVTFFVRSRIGDVVLAELQSGYKIVTGTVTPLTAFSTTVGNLYIRNARIYTPPRFLRCDTTAANAGLTNCAQDDGFAAWYDAEIAVDDYILLDEEQDRFVNATPDSHITARSQAAGTITLAGASMRATEIRRRIRLLSRTGPANV